MEPALATSGKVLDSLMEALAEMPDPRHRRGRRHPLRAILALTVCAMLCGARSLYAIAQWGRDQGQEVAARLGFSRQQTPCTTTLHYLFRRLDRTAWEGVLQRWLETHSVVAGEALAIDGKRLRGIHGEEMPGIHLVAAYGHQSGVVVGQVSVSHKRNELEAVPRLVEQLPLRGRVVTGDAHLAQRELSKRVVAKGGTTSGW